MKVAAKARRASSTPSFRRKPESSVPSGARTKALDSGFRRNDEQKALTHLDADNRPRMVDVGAKRITARVATAQVTVSFPAEVARALRDGGMRAKKGPVIDTAIIAGTLAAKRTHELIPFCHPLAIERCDIAAGFVTDTDLEIRCTVAVSHKTGVEMEALTGASVAALTVYDMCKALSHEIVIADLRLVEKSGGKRNVKGGKITK